jgi:hypothetical protein
MQQVYAQQIAIGSNSATARRGPSNAIRLDDIDGGRDRDRTCDPYHVKEAFGQEMKESQCSFAALSGNNGQMFNERSIAQVQ